MVANFIAFAALVFGAWQDPQAPDTGPTDPTVDTVVTTEYEVAARDKVRDELRDPTSAYFRDVVVRSDGEVEVICGSVAGRNGFGGMGDPMPFYMSVGMVFMEDSPGGRRFVRDRCALYPIVVRRLDWN